MFRIIVTILMVINLFSFEASLLATSDKIISTAQTYYKYRDDGSPGREIIVNLTDDSLSGKINVELNCEGKIESQEFNLKETTNEFSMLLPEGISVEKSCNVYISVSAGNKKWEDTLFVDKMRYWDILIYPHSHVDIGYTNTHKNVELIHTRNIVNGLELAKNTKDYPEGARYLWNPEVIWPFDMYLKKASPEEKKNVIAGVKDGYLFLDAGYVNLNTSLASDEEMMEFFRSSQEYEKITGKKIETIVQVDIPGMSWGIVPVAAKFGIKYIFTFNNGYDSW